MKVFAYLSIAAWLVSCAPHEPAGEGKGQPGNGNNEVEASAESDPAWLFSSDQLTVGVSFWVRVDVAGKVSAQLKFTLEGCGEDFFLMNFSNIRSDIGHVNGTVGSVENLVIFRRDGTTAAPAKSGCSLQATIINRKDGAKDKTFTKGLTFRSGNVSLGSLDVAKLSSGKVSAHIDINRPQIADPFVGGSEFVGINICRRGDIDSSYGSSCKMVGYTDGIPRPANGIISSQVLKAAFCNEGEDIDTLPTGRYIIIGGYEIKGSKEDIFEMAAMEVTIADN